MNVEKNVEVDRPKPVASFNHTLGFAGIVAAVVYAGSLAQNREVGGVGLVETHAHVIPMYVSAMVMNWLLVFFVSRGIGRAGFHVGDLIGGRWFSVRDGIRDVGIAFVFWGLLVGVDWVDRSLGQGHAKSLGILLPRTPLEVAVWIVTACSAGFCEELVFRGYVQRQVLAWSGRAWLAVVGQAVAFGVMHAYQGWRNVLVISVMGVLFGALAVWRRTLRVGMIAHAWQDVWGGWLSALLFR